MSIFLNRGLFENLQNQTFLENIRDYLDVVPNTNTKSVCSGRFLITGFWIEQQNTWLVKNMQIKF